MKSKIPLLLDNYKPQRTHEAVGTNQLRLSMEIKQTTYFPFSADMYSSHVMVLGDGGVRDCRLTGCSEKHILAVDLC